MTVVPQSPGLSAVFVLPGGLQPARSNLPGTIVNQHWQATFVAIPPEGITWRASFPKGKEGLLGDTRAIVISHRYPGGAGWQSLPAWLPQDHAVWSADGCLGARARPDCPCRAITLIYVFIT